MISQAVLLVTTFLVVPCSAAAVEPVHSGGPSGFLQKHNNAAKSDSDSGGAFDDGPQPSCSCDCCNVVRRLPGEIQFGAGVKCIPSGEHSTDMCDAQCSPSKEDKVLQEDVVDVERFCFFECKPATGNAAPVKSQCVAFTEDEAAKTIDQAGNPIDPAFLYGTAPSAADFYHGLSNQPPASIYSAAAASANLLSKSTRLVKAGPTVSKKTGKSGCPQGQGVIRGRGQGRAPGGSEASGDGAPTAADSQHGPEGVR